MQHTHLSLYEQKVSHYGLFWKKVVKDFQDSYIKYLDSQQISLLYLDSLLTATMAHIN